MKNILSILFFLTVSERVFSFPDTIRHGYTNCTACHISPSGGGLINSYGRSLSKELLSTWGYENEENYIHGLAKIPDSYFEKFIVGGDVRYLSRKNQSQSAKIDEGFLMQAQARFGVIFEQIKLIMSVGKIENPRESSEIIPVSTEYYAQFTPKEEIFIRAGRFQPNYGLRMPDHNLWTKSALGFEPWAERDTVEFIYEGEKQFFNLSGFQSTSLTLGPQTTGYTASFYQVFWDKNRVGLSGMNSEGQGLRMKALSGHATISLTEKLFSLTEVSRLWIGNSTKQVGFSRLGYELTKGVIPFAQIQFQGDPKDKTKDQYKYGGGVNWLPRPHFEIFLLYERLKKSSELSDESLFMFHYYF